MKALVCTNGAPGATNRSELVTLCLPMFEVAVIPSVADADFLCLQRREMGIWKSGADRRDEVLTDDDGHV